MTRIRYARGLSAAPQRRGRPSRQAHKRKAPRLANRHRQALRRTAREQCQIRKSKVSSSPGPGYPTPLAQPNSDRSRRKASAERACVTPPKLLRNASAVAPIGPNGGHTRRDARRKSTLGAREGPAKPERLLMAQGFRTAFDSFPAVSHRLFASTSLRPA